jgi:hypothetical protein
MKKSFDILSGTRGSEAFTDVVETVATQIDEAVELAFSCAKPK